MPELSSKSRKHTECSGMDVSVHVPTHKGDKAEAEHLGNRVSPCVLLIYHLCMLGVKSFLFLC